MRDRKGPRETQETEAEIPLRGLQVKKSQGAGEIWEKAWEDYPCEPLKGGQHRGHLDLELLASKTTRGYVSIVLSHQISGDWLLKSQETQRL